MGSYTEAEQNRELKRKRGEKPWGGPTTPFSPAPLQEKTAEKNNQIAPPMAPKTPQSQLCGDASFLAFAF